MKTQMETKQISTSFSERQIMTLGEDLKNAGYDHQFRLAVLRAVNSHEVLLDVAKDALCELDPDCNYDGSNYNGEPSDKGNSRIQTILALYEAIEQAEGK